ncbi:quinolinate synthase NadA [Tepidibacter hydrothermalis]|uniref:quinolinate synthase n=1 Tax=Tepidibacter hydrothermalis TaxID=3036126 RepID=A0ABY8EFE7_9FIRM|nr:quinolinate synthase NadA [Tepidibacter hydrothermalis]WFD10309.1 quinolinate synthase NadA [Tepidibacter hydrothermalis]
MISMMDEILKIKEEKSIKIFAHNYQNYEVQQIADYVGDYLELIEIAKDINCETIISCGVKSLAQTLKLVSDKKVILPVDEAVCPMNSMVNIDELINFKNMHPKFTIVSTLNSQIELKAVSDICIPTSKAVEIAEKLDSENILFVSDMNLGNYISKKVKNKNIMSWTSYCNIHDKVTKQEVLNMKEKHPNIPIIVHTQCREDVINSADYAGSTSQIIEYVKNLKDKKVIIGTETGILHVLRRLNPDKKFDLLSPTLICMNMKKTSLEDIYKCITQDKGQNIEIDEKIRLKALNSIDNMMKYLI